MSSRTVNATISAGGVTIAPISLDVEFNMQRSAGSFRASMALNDPNNQPDYWASAAPIEVEIAIQGQQLFVGQVDDVTADYRAGTLNIMGRDLSALLMDKTTTEGFQNRPRWSVVAELAGRVGLGFSDGGTGTVGDRAGQAWEQSHSAAMKVNQSYWTIIDRYARIEGATAYVLGRTLYYLAEAPGSAGSFQYQDQSQQRHASGNVIDITFRRNLALAKSLKVTVNGYRAKKKKAAKGEAQRAGAGGEMEIKTGRVGNIDDGEAQRIADATLKDWVDKQFGCTVTIPGDTSKRVGSSFSVSGTAFDGTYTMEGIHHSVSIHSPYVTRLHGRRGQ